MLEKDTINGKPIRDGKQIADLLTEVIMSKGLSGNFQFVNLILDRTEGKVGEPQAAQDDIPGKTRAFLDKANEGDDDDDEDEEEDEATDETTSDDAGISE